MYDKLEGIINFWHCFLFFAIVFKGFGAYRDDRLSKWVVLNKYIVNDASHIIKQVTNLELDMILAGACLY